MAGEFNFIQNIKKKYGLTRIGDDCAVLPKDAETDLVVTADMLVENIDFRLEWARPEDVGHKALAVSLSDIAAMGATPKWAMLSIGAPKNFWDDGRADRFFEGYMSLAKRFGVELIGGDISSTEKLVVIDSVAAGEVSRGNGILRSGASTGDLIFVAGTLGAAAAGLKILECDGRNGEASELVQKQLCPMPRTDIGIAIGTEQLASAMIDVSDGLSSDLHHICEASGVGARIFADQIPYDPQIDSADRLDFALNGGEDLALLFTIPPANADFANALGARKIGEITVERDIRIVIDETEVPLDAKGFRHF